MALHVVRSVLKKVVGGRDFQDYRGCHVSSEALRRLRYDVESREMPIT